MAAPDHREQTRRGYDAVAIDYARLVAGLDVEAAMDVAMIDDFAVRCLTAGTGPVLDAGCGTGRVSAHLYEHGLEVVGVDLSPGMISAASREHPQLHFVVGALEQLPLGDHAFGGLLAWYSLIHTAPDRLHLIIEEFARVLRPNGWLLTAFQDGAGERVDRDVAYGRAVAMTNYRHDPATVIRALEAGGFVEDTWLRRSPQHAEKTSQTVLLFSRQR